MTASNPNSGTIQATTNVKTLVVPQNFGNIILKTSTTVYVTFDGTDPKTDGSNGFPMPSFGSGFDMRLLALPDREFPGLVKFLMASGTADVDYLFA